MAEHTGAKGYTNIRTCTHVLAVWLHSSFEGFGVSHSARDGAIVYACIIDYMHSSSRVETKRLV